MRTLADEQDLFGLLGIDESMSWKDVRQAFRAAVRASHPDRHPGDAGAERRLKAINAAWETVNTPSKWAAYVRPTRSGARPGGPGQARRTAAIPAVGRLRVQRQLRGAAGLYNWKLELDGIVVASIENGGTTIVDAAPGRHRLRVFYSSLSSLPLQVELHRGQELHLGCRQLQGLRTSLLTPKRALRLELLSSRRFA